MKKIGTTAAINFHVSLVEATNFHCDLVEIFRNNINLNYHIISTHILLLQEMRVLLCFNVTSLSTTFWSVRLCFHLLLYILFLVFRSTEETSSAKLPIVMSVMRDKSHEGEAKPTYRKKSEKFGHPKNLL